MGRHSKPSRHRTAKALATASGAFAAVPLVQGVAHADSQDWDSVRDAIVHCESGGNPKARNPESSAAGLFQITVGTWLSAGGGLFAKSAAQATPAQQEQVAQRIFSRSGTAPWNASRSCWKGRAGKTVTASKRLPPAAPKHAAKPAGRTYTVKPGDSLSAIAQTTGHTWQQLWQANRAAIANPALIHVGAVLQLP